MANRIDLKTSGRYEEGVADGVVKPGMLLDSNGASTYGRSKWRVHPVEGGTTEAVFAMEDVLQGKTVDDAYADGDVLPLLFPQDGDEVLALLDEGHNYTHSALLTSKGDGTLTLAGSAHHVVAEVIEAVNLTAGGAVDTLKPVRIRKGIAPTTTTTT